MPARVIKLVLLAFVAMFLAAGPAAADTSVTTLPDGTYTYEGGGHSIAVTCAGGACSVTVEGLSGALTAEYCTSIRLCVTLKTGKKPRVCPGGGPQESYYAVVVTRDQASVVYVEPGDAAGYVGPTDYDCFIKNFEETWPILSNTSLPAASDDGATLKREGPESGPFGDAVKPRNVGHLGSEKSLAGGGAADSPSVLSSLPTPADLSLKAVLIAAGVTVVLVILTAFPTALLDSAAESGSARLAARRKRRRGVEADDEDTPDSRWWWAVLGVFLAAVISMFVDPNVGFNAGSARMLGSLALSLAIEVILSWVLMIWVVRRVHTGAAASFEFKPVTLLLVAGAVALSRVTGFEPGIVFGLVAGVGFVALTTAAETARVALAQLGWVFGLALVGWLAYSAMGEQTSAVGVFTSETLAGLAVGGFSAMPIALFPLRGLGGHDVFEWSKSVWAVVYCIGLLGFLAVVMPMPGSFAEVSWSLTAWIVGYLIYLGVAVGAWIVLRERTEPEAAKA